MCINAGMTVSKHSSSSAVEIGSSARDFGEHFLIKDRIEFDVICLNNVKVEP